MVKAIDAGAELDGSGAVGWKGTKVPDYHSLFKLILK